MEEFGYRNLIVWQKAKKLVGLVYAEVKKLPAEERYAMGDQIRRAVVSIPDELGSGVRKMFKYGKAFAGYNPTLTEDDLFRSELLLGPDIFKPDGKPDVPINVPINETVNEKVFEAIMQSPGINRAQLAKLLKVDVKTIGRAIAALSGSVEDRGSKKTGGYYVSD